MSVNQYPSSPSPSPTPGSPAPGSITDVAGIVVGHHTDRPGGTGCTVILCEGGAVAGVDVRGSSPGTRETDLLHPTASVPRVHAILLSGGSAFGLAAADGVVRYLRERGVGHRAPGVKVPIVPAAILFDLRLGGQVIPGPDDAYKACRAATGERPVEGTVGAGTGATVAKVLGRDGTIKGGVGTAALKLGDGTTVGAIVATNAIGGVYDAESGRVIAGPRRAPDVTDVTGVTGVTGARLADTGAMADSVATILAPDWAPPSPSPSPSVGPLGPEGVNTTIGVVATDAALTKAQASRMASAAHDGLAMAVRPAHTVHDGDTFFALATGVLGEGASPDLDRITAAAAICVAAAVARSVTQATGLGGVPALMEL